MKQEELNQIVVKDKIILLKENQGVADSFWITLETKAGVAEGKIHLPYKQTDNLVIFEPGFPGGGSVWLEEVLLKKLLKENYTVFLVRHVGTIINGKHSKDYIGCQERQEIAKRKRQKVLGVKKSNTIADWLKEPRIALEALTPYYETVFLTGHSFGPLAAFSSLIDFAKSHPRQAKRVKRFISLAGALGIVRDKDGRILSQWREYLDKKWSKERVLLGDTDKNIVNLHRAYKKIHREAHLIPSAIGFIAVHPWGDKKNTTDEFVHITESLDIISTLGRGYLIIDKDEFGDEKTGRIAHDMDNLKAETFFKLVNLDWLPESQISVLKQ